MIYYVEFPPPVVISPIQLDIKLSKSAPGFRQTRAMVSKLIRIIIETGFVTGTYLLNIHFEGYTLISYLLQLC